MTLQHLLYLHQTPVETCNGTQMDSEESDNDLSLACPTAEPSHLSTLNPTEAEKIVPEMREGQIYNEQLHCREQDHGVQFDFIYTVCEEGSPCV